MRKSFILSTIALTALAFVVYACNSKQATKNNRAGDSLSVTASANNYGGFANEIAWGHHLVMIGGCSDCHTPKKMTKMGPVPNPSLYLSGHPANVPPPNINPKLVESKGLIVTTEETVWIGPWGISYSSNLTPDKATGLGSWSADQFIRAIRKGKYMGVKNGRQLLPPMPWRDISKAMSDAELKAIFAYLRSIKPVHNAVPEALPPVAHPKH